ncbi:MAG TPA: VWA domain-containing protein, partial [candidate division Zixibacteria bacterium]|nr:VWA domain-containing protein [candidate division Zixibacteria bacterium]
QFNGEEHKTTDGKKIVVQANHVTSGASMNALLDGSSEPTVWSPGDGSWVELINSSWRERHNQPVNSQSCRPTIQVPAGFAMWRPMAEELGWPDEPIGWDMLVALAADPEGWASYGHPEWGRFSFGHTHPAYSNTGLLSMTSFVYGALGNPESLTATQVYEAEEAMRALEQVTSKYGTSSSALLDLMAREGPGYLHAAAVPEANVARYNVEHGDELQFPLAFIIPAGGTIWADHPYCVLDHAEWVSPEEVEAATLFGDYLLAPEQQALTVANYLRPVDPTIPLQDPLSLKNGVDPTVSPETVPALSSPDSAVSAAVTDLFMLSKRPATVIILIDTSGSMHGDKIRAAREATIEFIGRLNSEDEVAVMKFASAAIEIIEPQQIGYGSQSLSERIDKLQASGGTALHQAVCKATRRSSDLKDTHEAAGESRLYGIVLLSDGMNMASNITEGQMFADCLPDNAEVEGFKIFSIAFGGDANEDLLGRISDVTGGRFFKADTDSISDVYLSITAEQ